MTESKKMMKSRSTGIIKKLHVSCKRYEIEKSLNKEGDGGSFRQGRVGRPFTSLYRNVRLKDPDPESVSYGLFRVIFHFFLFNLQLIPSFLVIILENHPVSSFRLLLNPGRSHFGFFVHDTRTGLHKHKS